MTKSDRTFVLVAAIAALAWWAYTRQQGLTLAGEYANPMLPPAAAPNKQSLVTPTGTTGTLATNVFSAIGNAVTAIARTLGAAPGNTRLIPSGSSTIDPRDVSSFGLQVSPGESAPALAAAVVPDESLNDQVPFWSWGYTGFAGLPAINYIPPGAR